MGRKGRKVAVILTSVATFLSFAASVSGCSNILETRPHRGGEIAVGEVIGHAVEPAPKFGEFSFAIVEYVDLEGWTHEGQLAGEGRFPIGHRVLVSYHPDDPTSLRSPDQRTRAWPEVMTWFVLLGASVALLWHFHRLTPDPPDDDHAEGENDELVDPAPLRT